MQIWVLSTCLPEESEPAFPQVFASQPEAEKAFDEAMRNEWAAIAEWNDEGTEQLPYPGDPRAAHAAIVKHINDGSWGKWELTGPHEVPDQTPQPAEALARQLVIRMREIDADELANVDAGEAKYGLLWDAIQDEVKALVPGFDIGAALAA